MQLEEPEPPVLEAVLFEPPQPAATRASAATAAERASFQRTGASVTPSDGRAEPVKRAFTTLEGANKTW